MGGPEAAADAEVWVGKLRESLDSGPVPGTPTPSQVFNALAVEPPRSSGVPSPSYVAANVFRLQELTAARGIADLKSRLQRTDPEAEEHNRMFSELMRLENKRRALRDRAMGVVD